MSLGQRIASTVGTIGANSTNSKQHKNNRSEGSGTRWVSQVVKTLLFHGNDTGSIPVPTTRCYSIKKFGQSPEKERENL